MTGCIGRGFTARQQRWERRICQRCYRVIETGEPFIVVYGLGAVCHDCWDPEGGDKGRPSEKRKE